jgi:Predicted dehydrogenases and related proteins
VDDLAAAVLFLIEHYDSPEIINVGCGEDISIRELAELICDVVGFRGELKWDRSKPDGTPRKLLDISRIKNLGWEPTIALRDGIARFYEWFLDNYVPKRWRVCDEKLRIGVVGVGHIGSNHARIYSELPNAELVAILDIDPARADEIGAKYKAKAVASLNEFAGMIDAASVATPTSAHFFDRARFAGAGQAFAHRETDHRKDQRRARPGTGGGGKGARLASRPRGTVQSRFERAGTRLTHPRFIEAHRLSPYPNRSTEIGVVLDLMIHDLEIILHLVDSTLENIDAVGVPVLSRGEDIANARLRFASGCIANVTSSRISPERMRKIRVFQEDAIFR